MIFQRLEGRTGIAQTFSIDLGDFGHGEGIVGLVLEHFFIVLDGALVVALGDGGCGFGHLILLDLLSGGEDGFAKGVSEHGDKILHSQEPSCSPQQNHDDQLYSISRSFEEIPEQ